MKVRVDLPFTVHCMTSDALRKERIVSCFLHHPDFSFHFSHEPAVDPDSDLAVVPAGALRSLETPIPILAYGGNEELRQAFLEGCTDFLREPWEPEELYWRSVRILRDRKIIYPWGTVTVHRGFMETGDAREELTACEYRILTLLLRFRGDTVRRETLGAILESRGAGREGNTRAVDMHVSNIRRKLKALRPSPGNGPLITSVRNRGYTLY